MSDKQKAMRAALDALRKENDEIARRQTERGEKLADERHAENERKGVKLGPGRELLRMHTAGMRRDVIFLRKMAVPKKRR